MNNSNRPLTLAEQFAAESETQEYNRKNPKSVEVVIEVRQYGNPEREIYEKTKEVIKARKNKTSKEPKTGKRKNKQTENFKVLGELEDFNNKK